MRISQTPVTSSVRLDCFTFTMSLDASVSQLGILVFGELKSGRLRFESDRSDRRFGPGSVYFAVQPGYPYAATMEQTVLEQAVLDAAVLSQVAGTAPGRRPQPIRFTGYQPATSRDAQAWKDTYAYARDTVLARPDAALHPLLAAATARLLAATALAVFPSNALTDPTIEDRHDAHPATLRRAIAFIDENAHTDISVADIAAAACVTIRAVQLAFRRHLDTTPLAYLRRVRLGHAHDELKQASPGDGVTVAQGRLQVGLRHPQRLHRQLPAGLRRHSQPHPAPPLTAIPFQQRAE
jgi:AraC-like DNA-binding protein